MELVYLWVEDYKNIHRQGFNFSPRFRCEYNEDTNELTIDENKEYVSIFPDNINVTAIVGENGSGKSRLLRQILKNVNEHNISDDRQQFIQCYFDTKNKKILVDAKPSVKCQIHSSTIICETIQDAIFRDRSFFYHYKNDLDKPINFNKYGTYNEAIIKFSEPNKPNNQINLEVEEEKNIKKLLFLIDSTKFSIKENKFFIPDKVWLHKENIRILGNKRAYDQRYQQLKNDFVTNNQIKESILLENILWAPLKQLKTII